MTGKTRGRSAGKGLTETGRMFRLAGAVALVSGAIGAAGITSGLSAREQGQHPQQVQDQGLVITAPVCESADKASLVPGSGALFGVNLDPQAKTLTDLARDLGRKPAVSVAFSRFPYSATEKTALDQAAEQTRANGWIMMLTLEPASGLNTITPESAAALAADLSAYNANGVPVIVRFGQEMNGSWHPWAQQPARYIEAFRTIADAVHAKVPGSAMMWAPNYGGGYPFSRGQYEAQTGSQDFAALDTDADGALTVNDDPYAPYYPGDDAVDWVGISLFHWGTAYPWGVNDLPEANKFADQLTGSYVGANADDRPLPDFYRVYAQDHGKPLAITESAAVFAPELGGQDELAIKQAWWTQLFDPTTANRFPQLKMINWFEWDKEETEVNARVDWTVTKTPEIRGAFTAALPDWLHFGPGPSCAPAP
ncbi:glycoside hydrolase family 26 protein [Pseudarthrobacter sp. NamE5]|uniref:glycoside hydrolase family 26 protein n=1 Tax=Pseudarthrobacter sp. NamE5 TaxID=2576839 RepID=UPI00352A60EC